MTAEDLKYIENRKIVVPFFFVNANNVCYDTTPFYIYYDIGQYVGDGTNYTQLQSNNWSNFDRFNLVLNFASDYTRVAGDKVILPLSYPHGICTSRVFTWFLRTQAVTGQYIYSPFNIQMDMLDSVLMNVSKQPHGLNGNRSDLLSYIKSQKLKLWSTNNNYSTTDNVFGGCDIGIIYLLENVLAGEYIFRMSVQ